MTDLQKAAEIKTWSQRCDEHPDHEGIVSTQMIMDRMQEEIDELRQALAQDALQKLADIDHSLGLFIDSPNVDVVNMSQEPVDETAKGEHEPYDQTALELCEKCGWKAIIPDEGCLVCARNEQEPVMWSIFDGKYHDVFDTKYDVDKIIKFKKGKVVVKPLYTAPPKKEWVGLTDEERRDIREWQEIQKELGPVWAPMMLYLYVAIEAKLKEKNT